MQEKIILNHKEFGSTQSRENWFKSDIQLKFTFQQMNAVKGQGTKTPGQATEEAIDVLSFMGFKL